jgi:DNA polymerase II large subunit
LGSVGYFDDAVPLQEEEPDEADDFDFEPPEVAIPSGRGASEEMERYFAALESRMRREYELARLCREKGFDPETRVEIPPAIDLAARVEELVGPKGVAQRIRDLSKEKNREELSLIVANEVAAGKFGTFDDKEKALDQAVRTGLAILTEGILVAPLEGIAGVRLLKNDDGTDCCALVFAGPIRAAGGTGQALSVLIADVVRRALGIGKYVATEKEISRMKEEIPAYRAAANLQYTPSNEEIELIMRSCPVMIDGEGTEKDEIGGNRDLPRLTTNQIRGGACLVLAEGMTQKAPKIQKNVRALKLDGWEFIDQVIDYVKKKAAGGGKDEAHGGKKFTDPWAKDADAPRGAIEPSAKFMLDLIAGRPVFAHPSRKGGWRLRYGRARTGGLATTAIHPAAMALCDDFLAPGTQMKIERPGKATATTPCDSIEPPLVLLANGSLVEVTSYKMAKQLRPQVRQVVDLGEILVPYGEFAENNKTLPQSPWCEEWWRQTVRKATGAAPPELPTARDAVLFAERTQTPLAPRYNLFWHDLSIEDIQALSRFAEEHGRWAEDMLLLPKKALESADPTAGKRALRDIITELGALNDSAFDDVRFGRHAYAMLRGLGLDVQDERIVRRAPLDGGPEGPTHYAAHLAGFPIRPRGIYRIGTRMGRPEKAAERKMNPPVHLLFPISIAGGPQRLLGDAMKAGPIEIEVGERACPACKKRQITYRCDACGAHTEMVRRKEGERIEPRPVEIAPLVEAAMERLKLEDSPDAVKAVVGLISKSKSPEPIEKGLLRAKHNLFTFKDATVRFDMINITLTHFKPREAHVSVERLKELGYLFDIKGDPLVHDQQILEIKVQDIIVSTSCLDYMLRASQYVDELLVKLYGYKPYYNCKKIEDLYGHLFVALAPHTSGGVLCRIIGHTRAQGHYGHPFFHASKRRNCFRGDTEVVVLREGRVEKTRLDALVAPAIAQRGRALDGHGTRVAEPDEPLEILSLDPATMAPRRLRVTKLIQGTTRSWIDVETSTHRRITVTLDHRVLVRREGRLLHVPASEVAPGDQVPVAMSLPRETSSPTFELGALLADLPEAATLRLRDAEPFLRALLARVGRERVEELCGATPAQRRIPSRWLRSFPLTHYAALARAGLAEWREIPAEARLAFARDDTSMPVRVPATRDLCWLLGFYLAEGYARSTRSAHQVSWRVPEPTLRARLVRVIQETFGREPAVEEESKVTLPSRIAYLLLAKVWKAGEGAHEKRVPAWCYGLPDALVASLVAGYFDGDGSAFVEPPRLRLYSANRALLEDFATLLQSQGIFARFVPGEPREPGSFLRARYEALGRPPPETLGPVDALSLYGADIKAFAALVEPAHPEKASRLAALLENVKPTRVIQVEGRRFDPEEGAHHLFDRVLRVARREASDEPTYCLDVDSGSDDLLTRNVLLGNGLYQIRCDGDEDCVMLLLDGLLNFSRVYLPSNRGGLMDAPLTLTMRLDPSEVDKEAHNVDTMFEYPLEFFEATLAHPGPKDVEKMIDMVAKRLGKPSQYEGFGFTHDTADIAEGPEMSAYKTIGSMMDKMTAQLELAARIRAVDAPDVAARVIGSHFLPDMMGNLKAFSKQAMRCTKCNTKYRRIPLTGKCRKCGNANLTMTVHEGSVKKYLEVSKEVCVRFDVSEYVQQRIEHVSDSIDSVFTNDRVKKAKLSDFF